MRYIDLSSDDIVPDPENSRKTFTDIEKLADSIEEHGLIQNLVVTEARPGIFQIVAGERRWRAIRLSESRGHERYSIHCLLKDGDAIGLHFVQLAENEGQQAVAPWELGRRYLELAEAGLTQDEIGARSGCSQIKVSSYSRIAHFLAPGTVARLNRLGPTALSVGELKRISVVIFSDTKEPDEKGQIAVLQKIIASRSGPRRRRAPGTPNWTPERMMRRYRAILSGATIVPEDLRPVVEAVLEYLGGKTGRILWPENSP